MRKGTGMRYRYKCVLPTGYSSKLMTLGKARDRALAEVYAHRLEPTNGVSIVRGDGELYARYWWDGGMQYLEY